jgi:hypothetical protein
MTNWQMGVLATKMAKKGSFRLFLLRNLPFPFQKEDAIFGTLFFNG